METSDKSTPARPKEEMTVEEALAVRRAWVLLTQADKQEESEKETK
jgi:hypothetical protein